MSTKKTKFKIYYEEQETYFSELGSHEKQEYQLVIDKDGLEHFEKAGVTNTFDEIQSYKDSVDVNKIIERYQLGDTEALNKVKGFYSDVSNLDMDYRQLCNLNIRGEAIFNNLPAEVRNAFDNSYSQFVMHPEKFTELQKSENQKIKKAAKEISNQQNQNKETDKNQESKYE